MTRYVAVIITARGPAVTAKVAPGLGSTAAAGKLAETVAAARRRRAALAVPGPERDRRAS